jgi:hypothetical protein
MDKIEVATKAGIVSAEAAENAIYASVRETLVAARTKAYTAINSAMVEAYWTIGREISEAQGHNPRAEYGSHLLQYLSDRLTAEFGKGFEVTNLRKMRQFYQVFQIRDTLCLNSSLSWSHYRLLMRIDDQKRREFYVKECAECNWSVRQLERQINSFFYERLLATRKEGKDKVANEIQKTDPKTDPDYILKDPLILEFLDLKEKKDYQENELEQSLIDN